MLGICLRLRVSRGFKGGCATQTKSYADCIRPYTKPRVILVLDLGGTPCFRLQLQVSRCRRVYVVKFNPSGTARAVYVYSSGLQLTASSPRHRHGGLRRGIGIYVCTCVGLILDAKNRGGLRRARLSYHIISSQPNARTLGWALVPRYTAPHRLAVPPSPLARLLDPPTRPIVFLGPGTRDSPSSPYHPTQMLVLLGPCVTLHRTATTRPWRDNGATRSIVCPGPDATLLHRPRPRPRNYNIYIDRRVSIHSIPFHLQVHSECGMQFSELPWHRAIQYTTPSCGACFSTCWDPRLI
ncbi:hypothetical protein K438DRAFT_231264 [Mycena galopus ATCC 62051]|nr:hypothetical protein K438DRAFT_231264 [Mycena galopus ATCC 62051]